MSVDALVTVHSWVRWLVLLALIGGAVVGLVRYRRRADWDGGIFQVAVMILDIQVAIGVVIWIVDKAWDETFFFKVLHPVSMLAALAVAHAGFAVAKRRADLRSNLLAGASLFVSLVLIVLAIPWDRL
jgi:hypothetical protein